MMKSAAELLDMGRENLESLVAYCLTLQESLSLTSRNSSKPPSTDGYLKPAPKSLRVKTGKKTGGQPGHTGATLNKVEKPDIIEVHPLSNCPCGCNSDLSKEPVLSYENRQVFDLPPQKLIVTEHRVEIKCCPISGKLVNAPWPKDVTAPVQYGADFLAWLVYLNTQQFIPFARISQMSFDLFGQKVSEDTIIAAIKNMDKELEPFAEAVKEQLAQAPVLNADESGLRVEGKLHWIHVLSTIWLTWYGVHPKRGSEAVDAFGMLPKFVGRLVHDCWQTYLGLSCLHALCVAHLIRELIFIHEECEQTWAKSLVDLFLDMNRKREEQKMIATEFSPDCLEKWHQQYQAILRDGRTANPPIIAPPDAPKKRGRKKQTKAQNLLDRLEEHENWILAFLHDFKIPFTNNLAEQDIRMIKVKQKVSGSFRTLEGAERFAKIRSYISTARKQGRSILESLKAAITGNPFIPNSMPSG